MAQRRARLSFLWAAPGYPSPCKSASLFLGAPVSPAWYDVGFSAPASCHHWLLPLPWSSLHPSCTSGLFPKHLPVWLPHGPPAVITPGWLPLQRDSQDPPPTSSVGQETPQSTWERASTQGFSIPLTRFAHTSAPK